MATVPGSRPGAGGKIVTNRRRQRLSATPYDRPPPPPPPPPPPTKSPNWLTGVIIPSARALASGAGKFLASAIFSESEPSSEDEDLSSGDDVDDMDEYESPHDGFNALSEEKVVPSEMMQDEQEPQFSMRRTETKRLIEQLIMQETFSREENDKLVKVLNSRVMDCSTEAGERLFADYPGRTVDHEDVEVFNKAVLEAKSWFQQNKVGSGSDLAHGICDHNSAAFEHVESGVGSPVEVARSYMKEKAPWASPTKHVEFRSPLTTRMKLFKEGTPYSLNHDYLSSSKRRDSLSSGSWNIQDELRRVRSKATEDMLRTPPAKIDPSLFAVGSTRKESLRTGKVVSGMEEMMTEPDNLWKTKLIDPLKDVGVSSDPGLVVLALSALESRHDGKAGEAPSSNPAASVSGNNEDSEAIQIDGECAASKFSHPNSPVHAGERQSDPHSTKRIDPPATEVAEFGGGLHTNGFSLSQASLSPEVATTQKDKQSDEGNNNNQTIIENKPINVEGICEFLSEAYVEVPIVTETDSTASGSEDSSGELYEESPPKRSQPSIEEKAELISGKKRGRKPAINNRRSRGRGGK